MFGDDDDENAATDKAAQRKRRMLAFKLAQEKSQEVPLAAGTTPSMAAAAKKDDADDIDPLDAFMQETKKEADQLVSAAVAKEKREQEMRANGELVEETVEGGLVEQLDMSKHCYICKQFGHTKGQCPNMRCHVCNGVGHKMFDCDVYKEQEEKRKADEKKRKRQQQYHLKKCRRKHDWEDALRQKTGVYGFTALYEVLGLPTNKLANKRTIKLAYHKLSLVWHPDKQNGKTEDEKIDAEQKFLELKAAYDLLCEGLENGSVEGHAVGSAGELAAPAQKPAQKPAPTVLVAPKVDLAAAAKAKDLLAKLRKNIVGGTPNVLGNGASQQPAAAAPVRKMQSLSELNEFE